MLKSLNKIDLTLSRCSTQQIIFISLILLALITFIDYVADAELSFSVFYLIPIGITTWYVGHRAGIIFCVLCTVLWFFFDINVYYFAYAFAPYWNAVVRLTFFLIVEELLNHIKMRLTEEESLSRTDSLTSLHNNRGFTEQAKKLFRLAARHNRSISLAFLDLDNFKQVNDLYGHREGDRVLQVMGKKILTSLRDTDVAARLGGDEFAIILPETNEAGAKKVFFHLRNHLRQETEKYNWPITVSIGVVCVNSAVMKLEEAIKHADSLMYQVKKDGKNGIVFESISQD